MSDDEEVVLDEGVEVEEEDELVDEDKKVVDIGDGLPPFPPNGDSYQDRLLFAKQRACLLLLLRAKAYLALELNKEERVMEEKLKEREKRLEEERSSEETLQCKKSNKSCRGLPQEKTNRIW